MSVSNIQNSATLSPVYSGLITEKQKLQQSMNTQARYSNGAQMYRSGNLDKVNTLSMQATNLQGKLNSLTSITDAMEQQAVKIEELLAKAADFQAKGRDLDDGELIIAANTFLDELKGIINTADPRGKFFFGDQGRPINDDLKDAMNSNLENGGLTITDTFFRGQATTVNIDGISYKYADVKEAVKNLVAAANYAKGGYGALGYDPTLEERKEMFKTTIERGINQLRESLKNVVDSRQKLEAVITETETQIKKAQNDHNSLVSLSEEELEVISIKYREISDQLESMLNVWLFNLHNETKFGDRLATGA